MKQIKRITPEMLISIALLLVFFSGVYVAMPPAMQLLGVKIVLVSVGILHAHAAGKLIFKPVDWKDPFRPEHIVRIVLYAVIPLCYAFGG